EELDRYGLRVAYHGYRRIAGVLLLGPLAERLVDQVHKPRNLGQRTDFPPPRWRQRLLSELEDFERAVVEAIAKDLDRLRSPGTRPPSRTPCAWRALVSLCAS